ncbi:MAG TPA: MG2 domain-containing protein, partial [Candidatus Hydrogenedentes bacterium]|nr:MG2 domain-containing protein [Candidatus Hydrogenedentota bacterium]
MRLIDVLPQLETRLIASRDFLAGSRASVRIVAVNHATGRPAANARVELHLKNDAGERKLLTATTDAQGTLEERFEVPGDMQGRAELIARVAAPGLGEDAITQAVTIQRKTKILLTTDKPLYQPGQTIHLRALSLDMAVGRPVADRDLVFEVMDAKGNKVFKKPVQTDAYGIGFADFQLATEVNLGPYIVRALLDDVTTEKQVTVDRYVLPKFEVKVSTDRAYYLPGDTLKGEVQADYFFGKPVARGKVTVTASKFEIEFTDFATLEGMLDENGHWTFETKIPTYFAGTPIEQGQASVRLEAVVVDTADHREEKVVMKSVAAAALNIHAVPEGGALRPNLENRVYLLVTYPDGSPAQGAAVTVHAPGAAAPVNLQTDAVGTAMFTVTPRDAHKAMTPVQVRDREGRAADHTFTFDVARGVDSLLLRTDQALYNVGDTLRADVFATKPSGTVYFDLIRDGQTMMTRAADLDAGRATLELDLDATLSGSVVLQAYTFTPGTDLLRDARRVYVNPADALRIAVALDAETYRPGQEATLQFTVTDDAGRGAAAALGISIVDESVFALQEIHPGLEKIYFTLEREIMKPRYEIHGFELDTLIKEPAAWRPEQQQAARVLLASAPDLPPPPVRVNTFAEKEAAANRAIAERIRKDVEHIQKAVTKLIDDEKGAPKDILKTLLRKRLVRENELLDPWGNRYEFDFSGVQEWGGHFTMLSYGPDGVKGTADDIGPETAWGRELLDLNGVGRGGADLMVGRPMAVRQMKMFAAEPIPAPMMAETAAALDGADALGIPEAAPGAPVRVREYFPETLLFEPALITDARGRATLPLTLADSITTWRMTSMANAANGALGSMDAPIRVFQDFFVDIDLPVALTQNDRISIPVALYNYLETAQDIRLAFEAAPWFKLDGPA